MYENNTASLKVSRKAPSGIGSKTVYPIKNLETIKDMHRYFLQLADSAKTDTKKRLAYRNWLYFALGINLGFRGGDITELTWGQLIRVNDLGSITFVNRDDNFIHAEKTNKLHLIVLNEEARKVIRHYYSKTAPIGTDFSEDAPVFFSNKSAGTSEATVVGHMDVDNVGRILKKAAIAVGFEYNLCTHSLRKTFGYWYYKETQDLATLQKIFGHSSPAITLTYIGLDAETITSAYNRKPDTSIDFDNFNAESTSEKVIHFPNAI